MSCFFIDRPVFAWVLSIVIALGGLLCAVTLPIAQYPPIVPPTIQVTATYPGASARTLGDTVAQPIEEQVNGVEGMIYMSSACTNNGYYTLTVSFDVGTDVHTALMMVQIRTQLAMPQLPAIVQKQGVNVLMQSPEILLSVNLYSPDGSRDPLYLSNYAEFNLYDQLSRIKGVALVSFLGQRQYSMRAWLDPQKLAALDLTAGEVMEAIREQNVDVAAGNVGQQPVPEGQDYQLVLNTLGRLTGKRQFGDIVVKVGRNGRYVHLRDVARLELGAQNSDIYCTLTASENGRAVPYPSIGMAIYPLPTANSLDLAGSVKDLMDRLAARFPPGVAYRFGYDTTPFIRHSVEDVLNTIVIAAALVIVVVLVFIQDWHAMLLPIMDLVVALVGTFVVMKLLGFSLNNLSLFGLVLAVGIVVDDSIVVVENIERWMETGLPAREATVKAMEEITGPVIGITLVLASVFIPTAFIPGLSGQFFRQFALTVAVSAVLSATNALTMAPARAAAWIKPHGEGPHAVPREALPRLAYAIGFGCLAARWFAPLLLSVLGWFVHDPAGDAAILWGTRAALFLPGLAAGWFAGPPINAAFRGFFWLFNKAFEAFTGGYTRAVSLALRLAVLVLVLYAGLLALMGIAFTTSPTGFIPEQDQGLLVVNVELPDAASVQRTRDALARLAAIAVRTPGVDHTMSVAGFSAFFQADSSNWGTLFVILDNFDRRTTPQTQAAYLIDRLNRTFRDEVLECKASVFNVAPVPGLGQSAGFQLQIEDRTGLGFQALQEAAETIIEKANAQPGLANVFTTFRANTPQLYMEIDREGAKQMGVTLQDVFDTLNANMGSVYINLFNEFGRVWQVNVQAEGFFRKSAEELRLLKVRNKQGQAVPLASVLRVRDDTGPVFVMRYNDLNSAAVNGGTRPGFSSGQAISVMQKLCEQNLPAGMGYEWTNISYQETHADTRILGREVNVGPLVFGGAVVLVFLILAALYESWSLPLGIILVVPMCLLCSITGLVWGAGKPIDVFSQIGFVVLIAMAAKNAILIVEVARQKRGEGMAGREATLEACRLRLRPILMTSFAFVFGVWPLVVATGAGWEMRRSLGTAVFSGMIGVTFFGIFLTPVFYHDISRLTDKKETSLPPPPAPEPPPPTVAVPGDHNVMVLEPPPQPDGEHAAAPDSA